MNTGFPRWCAQVLQRFLPASMLKMVSDEDYVRMAYLVLLHRPIDPAGLAAWREQLASPQFNRQRVVETLLSSKEYLTRFGVNLFDKMHSSRQAWIKTVPAARSILDIGGSSANDPQGALIELGYPHRPERLHILDLPPGQQYWGRPKYDQGVPHTFDWGEVRFFHGSAERLRNVEALQQERYDMVFMGQAIEHVWPDALPDMLAWIRQHLDPDGWLVFDTPNRLLTSVQCPHSLIDPDHKHEYAPAELEAIVVGAGFTVKRRVGMLHLPVQATSRVYDVMEFAHAPLLSDDVDSCYLFALEAQVAK